MYINSTLDKVSRQSKLINGKEINDKMKTLIVASFGFYALIQCTICWKEKLMQERNIRYKGLLKGHFTLKTEIHLERDAVCLF